MNSTHWHSPWYHPPYLFPSLHSRVTTDLGLDYSSLLPFFYNYSLASPTSPHFLTSAQQTACPSPGAGRHCLQAPVARPTCPWRSQMIVTSINCTPALGHRPGVPLLSCLSRNSTSQTGHGGPRGLQSISGDRSALWRRDPMIKYAYMPAARLV